MPSTTKRNKSQSGSQVKLIANWQYIDEMPPAFKRLMMVLLNPRNNQSAEALCAEEEHQNEQ